MKALMIKDLTESTELDSKAMAEVSGGYHYLAPWGGPSLSFSLTDIDTRSVIADQNLAQVANVSVVNGANVAFAEYLTANVATSQVGSNNINVG